MIETTVDMAARGSSPKIEKTVALRCPWIDCKTGERCTYTRYFPLEAFAPRVGVTGNGPFARPITYYPGIQQYDCPVCGTYTTGSDLRMDNEEVFEAALAKLKAMEGRERL